MQGLNTVSNTFLHRTILQKALDLFKNRNFVRNTDNAILNEIFNLVSKVGEVANILTKQANNETLTKKERTFIEKNRGYFSWANDNLTEQFAYSRKINVDSETNTEAKLNYEQTDDFRRIQEESRKISKREQQLFNSGSREINETLRGRLSRAYGEILRRESSIPSNGYGLLENTNNFTIFSNVNNQLFHDIFEINKKYLKYGDLVDLHDDYNDSTCFLSDDGLSGFAITEEGDLISVFNLSAKKGWLKAISDYISKNAKTLDCYNPNKQPLNSMYETVFGFKSASILEYNHELMVEDKGKIYTEYFEATYGKPSVFFMVNTNKSVQIERFNKDQYKAAVDHQKSFLDYENLDLSSTDLNVEDAQQIKEIKSIDVSAHEVKAERNNSVYDNVLKLKDARKIYRNIVNYMADNFGAIVLNF